MLALCSAVISVEGEEEWRYNCTLGGACVDCFAACLLCACCFVGFRRAEISYCLRALCQEVSHPEREVGVNIHALQLLGQEVRLHCVEGRGKIRK